MKESHEQKQIRACREQQCLDCAEFNNESCGLFSGGIMAIFGSSFTTSYGYCKAHKTNVQLNKIEDECRFYKEGEIE